MKELVVDRSRWRCGANGPNSRGEGETRMHNESGFMCISGFLAEGMGVPYEKFLDKYSPSDCADDDRDRSIWGGGPFFEEGERLPKDWVELALTPRGRSSRPLWDSEFSHNMVKINDRERDLLPHEDDPLTGPIVSDSEREALLISLFKEKGIALRFTGDYVPGA